MFDSISKWVLVCGWLALFIGGVTHYSGSWLTYTMFSIVFLAMLTSGFYRQVSYGYLFLVTMLWLGFWLKLTVHLLVDYQFSESIGLFDKSAPAWDEVLWVATLGSIGVMSGRMIYRMLGGTNSSMLASPNRAKPIAPMWYPARRRWMWACLMSACVGLAIINAALGILQIGLVPKTVLLWPLHAVISWLIGYGLTFGVATLLWWDITLGRNVSMVVYFVLLEAFTSTVSILSRGAYIFHVIPQFFALYKNKSLVSGWSRKNIIAVCISFVLLFALSNPLVNMLRSYYYSNVPFGSAGGEINALAKFAVDRWIGVEGVMAISAHSGNGVDFFVQGIMERREIGKDPLYIEISHPVYLGIVDKTKFQFSEIPGAMAFLYYLGKPWVVLVGMAVLILAVLVSENWVFKLTGNPLLTAIWGGITANAVAQMGVAPRSLLIYFFEMFCGVAAIWLIQSGYFSNALLKFDNSIRLKNEI